jgi:NAD-dependent deacetylase
LTAVDIPVSLAKTLSIARSVVVLTGAGVSAESGVPTFREPGKGLWAKYDPLRLATPEAFNADPELVSRWYDMRRQAIAACRPNPGHEALAQIEAAVLERGDRFTLITQNIDRLHHAAGSRRVVELHGTLWRLRCVECNAETDNWATPLPDIPPRCECGGLQRPGVVWFGETLPEQAVETAHEAIEDCDLFLTIGTSAVVYPAAGLIHVAKHHGAPVAEFNLGETPVSSSVDWIVRAPSGVALPALLRAAFN